ncbi:MAG: hypothetical protein AAGF88_13060 [Pseudomonadota bacterium]
MKLIIFSDDVVNWRAGDSVWTVKGQVPLLSVECRGVCVQSYAATMDTQLDHAQMPRVLDSV